MITRKRVKLKFTTLQIYLKTTTSTKSAITDQDTAELCL